MLSFCQRLGFFVKYACIENKKHLVHFFLCILSCFLVGLVCLISKTILNEGPIIFLMITEQKTGEIDLVIRPSMTAKVNRESVSDYFFFNSFLNYSLFEELFKDDYYQSSPRIQIRGSAGVKSQQEKNKIIPIDLYIMDLKREKKIELGSSFPNIELEVKECIIHKNIAKLLNIPQKNGNETNNQNFPYLDIRVNLQSFLTNLLIKTYFLNITHDYNENITNIPNFANFQINFPCKVKHILEENFGKMDQDIHSTIIINYKDFFSSLADNLNNDIINYFPDFKSVLRNQNTYHYADEIIVNFPSPRINAYTVANFDSLQIQGVKYANNIVKKFGSLSSNFEIELPIIKNIKPLFNGAVFLSIILNMIIISLFGLSILLIFSLLQISIETRIFEFGILRIIGSTKINIVILLITQCFTFSIPSFILAYLAHVHILDIIQSALSSITETNMKLTQEFGSIIYGLIMTNIMPLIAAIYPIKSAFRNNLAYSLNPNISKTSGVKVEIFSAIKNEKNSMIIFGFLIFFYGISIYYFLPLSMLSMNWGLLLFILLWILMGMLAGLIILSINLEYIIQKFITYIFFFWTSAANKLLILKNLTAHRIRNRKTAIMYSLSVGFFILVDVGLKIELKTQELMSLQKTGAYYQLKNSDTRFLQSAQIFPTIYTMKKLKLIDDVTFISPAFTDVCPSSKTDLTNLGKMDNYSVDMLALPSNYFIVALPEFLKVEEEDFFDLEISEKMYMEKYHSGMGISGILTWEADIRMKDEFFLNILNNEKKMTMLFKPSFILNSAPGLKMTAEPMQMIKRSVLIPVNVYIDLLNKCFVYLNKNYFKDLKRNKLPKTNLDDFSYFKFDKSENKAINSFNDFPIEKVIFKLNSGVTTTELFDMLGDIVNNDPSYIVNTWSFYDYQKKLNKISTITSIIFNSVNLVILIFCFFNLSASMTININEQQKEISILRSMGITKIRLNYIYQAEAFILIFSSCIIGIFVGTLVSFTMTLQQVMFTNLPITFVFPFTKLGFLFIVSIISGCLSTIIPATIMLDQSISNMIKNS